jgi:hypothetical protein
MLITMKSPKSGFKIFRCHSGARRTWKGVTRHDELIRIKASYMTSADIAASWQVDGPINDFKMEVGPGT